MPGSFPPTSFATYTYKEHVAIPPFMTNAVGNKIHFTAYTLRHSYYVICHIISEQVGVAITF